MSALGLVLQILFLLLLAGALLRPFWRFFSELAQSERKSTIIWMLLVVVIAVLAGYRSPRLASNLEIVPDSVEYAVGARNLATHSSYEISINDQAYPPRYAPWFSALILSPSYLVFGADELGNATYALLIFAVLAAASVFALGYRVNNASGGIWALALLYSIPSYFFYSRQIMSDVPALALMLTALLLYLQLSRIASNPRLYDWASAGVICAVASLLRPGYFALLLPFLLLAFRLGNKKQRTLSVLLIITPTFLGSILSLVYNQITFGSPFRSGYNFWVGWPYDFPSKTFSFQYFVSNLQFLLESAWLGFYLFLVLALYFIDRKTCKSMQKLLPLLRFIWPIALSVLCIYLLYFYREPRFYLPLLAPLAICIGLLLSSICAQLLSAEWLPKFILLGLFVAFVSYQNLYVPSETRRRAVDLINSATAQDALIISGLDPVYLTASCGANSARKFIPISRRVEYASKMISLSSLSFPGDLPSELFEHRSAKIKLAGGQDVIPLTALESLEDLERYAGEGKPLFLEDSQIGAAEMGSLSKSFVSQKVGEGLLKLTKIVR